MRENTFVNVNLEDPRQDVHRTREEHIELNRYRVAERLLPSNSVGSEVLEVGGGAAEFSRRLQSLGIDVTFVDLSPSNVRRAASFGMKAHQLDLNCGFPIFPSETFDGIVMLEIIEHIVSAENLLKEACRVLKPQGFLILSTPNFAYWCNRLRILFGHLSHDEGYHYRFFTPVVLRQRLEEAGFAIDRTANTTPAIGYNFIANRLLRKPRCHIQVVDSLSPLLAHTLIVKCLKRC